MKSEFERFAEKIELGEDGCWLWMATTSGGYGHLGVDGKTWQVHRWAYEHFIGGLPPYEPGKSLECDHLCQNRNCCNPWHLELVTGSENIRRGARTKLTDAQVLEVRARYAAGGVFQQALADEYGVAQTYISQILLRQRRTNV